MRVLTTIGRKSVIFVVALLLVQFSPIPLQPAQGSPGTMNTMAFNLGTGAYPDIYAEENGKLHVTWKDGNVIRYRYYNGSSWQPTETPAIGGVSVWAKSPPTIWADANGAPHIVWAAEESHVYYINKVGGSWSSKLKLVECNDPSSFILRDTHIAVASDGTRHVIWRKKDIASGKGYIYCKKYQNGSWGSETLVSNASLTAKRPQLTLGGDDKLHVVWRGRGGPDNSYEVFYRRWSNGSWGSIEMATNTIESCGEDPHVATDNSNNPHISWPEGKTDPQVGYMYKSSGWSNPTYLGHGEDPVIAIDDRGTRYVIWNDEYRYNDGGGWAGAQVFDSGAITPDTFGDGQYAHTVYEKNDLIYYIALSSQGGGGDPWVTVTSPNGGENWQVGSAHNITWSSSDDITNVKLRYSTDSGSNWMTIVDSTPNDGSYTWTVPNAPSANCRVRVIDTTNSGLYDISDSDFTIATGGGDPWITVTDPNGGENWQVGSAHNITWDSSDGITNVKLRYSTNSGSTWITIIDSTPNDGSYSWTIPNTPSTNCRVRIIDTTNAGVYDVSNADFTISIQGGGSWITVTSPNGGEIWAPGSTQLITWDSSEDFSYVRIDYSTNSGQTWIQIVSKTGNDGSRDWTVPNTQSVSCRVRVQSKDDPNVQDMSNSNFTIGEGGGGGELSLLSPNGGENWQVGSIHKITWQAPPEIIEIRIWLSTDSGSNWTLIKGRTPNNGSWSWTVSNAPSTSCRIKVHEYGNQSVNDISDSDFTIYTQGSGSWITVTSPNGGESWKAGTTQTITWDASPDIVEVRLWGSIDSGVNWTLIKGRTPNNGSWSWTVPNTPSTHCRIKAQEYGNQKVNDISNSDFTIIGNGPPELSLNGGALPSTFNLWQNYPNPFNPSTQVRFDIPGEPGTMVTAVISIYDSRGRLVRRLLDESLQPGEYVIHWDGRGDTGSSLPSGIYLLYIRAGSDTETMKMVLTR